MNRFLAQIGTISPPPSVRTTEGDPSNFVASLVRNGIQFLLIAAFIVALLWTIFAGYRFMTSGGDPKTTGQAWSQMYWGLIGMLIVFGSYAIMIMVEEFLGVKIISGPFQLPGGP